MWKRIGFSAALIATSLAIGLIAIEAALLVWAGFGAAEGRIYRHEDLYVSSGPIAVFDRISGYRRTPGPMRIVRIMRDELVFDNTFTPNNAGYISSHDYEHRKTPGTTRVVVFGDSFTAADYIPVPWPDRVQEALKGKTRQPMELYSFAVNGGGLGLWHSIFFEDVVPHYNFDAVLIATYGDDLARGFSYLHYDGPQAYVGYFKTRPTSDEDFFANYLPKMPRHRVSVADNKAIDETIASLDAPWHWPGFAFRSGLLVAEQWTRVRQGRIGRSATAVAAPEIRSDANIAEIEAAYGADQFALLRDIVAYCKERNIPLILASVPGRDGASAVASGTGETPHGREVRSLAQHFDAAYFDGYAPFVQLRPEDIDSRYWLKYDAHWNQNGSDVFAMAIADFLAKSEQDLHGRETNAKP